ncbi:MAG: hypothetical protein JO316_02975 [Abitibacteriaceae bacterium]|nr:hypothetical protein [Abditibacteriaceae bacterium]
MLGRWCQLGFLRAYLSCCLIRELYRQTKVRYEKVLQAQEEKLKAESVTIETLSDSGGYQVVE